MSLQVWLLSLFLSCRPIWWSPFWIALWLGACTSLSAWPSIATFPSICPPTSRGFIPSRMPTWPFSFLFWEGSFYMCLWAWKTSWYPVNLIHLLWCLLPQKTPCSLGEWVPKRLAPKIWADFLALFFLTWFPFTVQLTPISWPPTETLPTIRYTTFTYGSAKPCWGWDP